MVLKAKNVQKARKKAKYKEAKENVAKPDDLDWSYVYTNEQMESGHMFIQMNKWKLSLKLPNITNM